jgi:uncharacterized protein YjgD (DUF1641 family)
MGEPLAFTPRRAKIGTSSEEELRKLLDALHRHGLLQQARELLDGAAGGLEEILRKIDQSSTRSALESLATLVVAFGRIDNGIFRSLANGVTQANARHDEPPPSLGGLLRKMRSPEVRRGIAVALELLGALGSRPPSKLSK